ncbi:MAG: HAMP domain-containing histidine kinase [Hamadaea sp.]|uniref:sensor histidine kinase n=1 Tax=Hamadaea sp. TaxID=2024425 RepID=UPI00184A4285|nr:HAMP domain-containing sensor histidine kinase [Hamadaea sp.]NUT18856.1 HAMP domain-containing histidine kinase [Hamadaea sp.]
MRVRLILLAVATSSLVLVGFLVPLALLVRSAAADRAVAATSLEAQTFVPTVAAGTDETIRQALDQANVSAAHPLTVFLPDGATLGVPAVRTAAVAEASSGRSLTGDVPGGREVLVAVQGRADGTAVIRAYVADDELTNGVAQSWLVLGGLGLGVLLVSVVVADRLANALVRPLAGVGRLAERLATGDLTARGEVTGAREVRQVALGLNRMAARIGDLVTHEREAAADLSHRLRTPLTALRIDAEALADPAERARIAADTAALEKAVDDVIRLARRPVLPTDSGSCDAVREVRDRMEFWSPLAEEEQRGFDVVLPTGPMMIGLSADELGVCVDALLGNVFAHTREGTSLRAELVRDDRSGRVGLTITDHGPGIPATLPLQRGASGDGSTGLGLDIARRTASAAGGRLTVGPTPGGGTTVVVDLGPELHIEPGHIRGRVR